MREEYQADLRNLCRNIAFYRHARHLTQDGLALKANISRGYLSQIEAENVEKDPSLELIFHLAHILGVPPIKFFEPRTREEVQQMRNKK